MNTLDGACHCGAVRVGFTSAKPASALPLRACQCGFCRRHGSRTTSDPDGRLHVEAAPGATEVYRFGRNVVDFVVCAACGTYVCAVADTPQGKVGVVNVIGMDLPGFTQAPAAHAPADDETDEARLTRRLSNWTPTIFVEAAPSA